MSQQAHPIFRWRRKKYFLWGGKRGDYIMFKKFQIPHDTRLDPNDPTYVPEMDPKNSLYDAYMDPYWAIRKRRRKLTWVAVVVVALIALMLMVGAINGFISIFHHPTATQPPAETNAAEEYTMAPGVTAPGITVADPAQSTEAPTTVPETFEEFVGKCKENHWAIYFSGPVYWTEGDALVEGKMIPNGKIEWQNLHGVYSHTDGQEFVEYFVDDLQCLIREQDVKR